MLGNGHLYAPRFKTLRKGFHWTTKLRVNSRGIDPRYVSHKFVEFFRRQDGRFFRIMLRW